jgi:AcrR family transcriptional regulator
MARPQSDIADRITTAARARFLRHGVDGASLRQIASDAGTNIGMVYYYFKTKDDLFLASIERDYARLVGELQQALDPDQSVEERLRRLYARFATLDKADFETLTLVLREALMSTERLSRIAARFERGHLPLMVGLVRDGVADGSMRADAHPMALMAATFMLALAPQLAHYRVRNSGLPIAEVLPTPQQAADSLLAILLGGIRPS